VKRDNNIIIIIIINKKELAKKNPKIRQCQTPKSKRKQKKQTKQSNFGDVDTRANDWMNDWVNSVKRGGAAHCLIILIGAND